MLSRVVDAKRRSVERDGGVEPPGSNGFVRPGIRVVSLLLPLLGFGCADSVGRRAGDHREPQPVLELSKLSGASALLPLDYRLGARAGETWQEAAGALDFTSFPPGLPNLGRIHDVVWLRARVLNDGSEDVDRVLVLGWPRLANVHAWRITGPPGGRRADDLGASGWEIPWAERPLRDPSHAFPVRLRAGEQVSLLLRVDGRTEMIFPTQLLSWSEMQVRERLSANFVGLYAGMVLVLVLYNILVFIRVRHSYHLLYAASALCFLPWWFINSGWTFVVPGAVGHLEFTVTVLGGGWHFFRLAFARDFLRLARVAPRLDRVLRVLQWLVLPLLLVFIYSALDPRLQEWCWTFLEIPLVVSTVVAGLVAYQAGVSMARWFLPATGLLLIGLVLGHVIFAGVLLNPLLAGLGIMAGMLLELIVLTLALAERAREMTAQNEQVLRHATAHRLNSLEALVAGVTHELNSPLGALRSTTDSFERAAAKLTAGPAGEATAGRALKALPVLARTSREATDRIRAVVCSLETFARLDEAAVESVDLSEGLRSALVLLQPRVPAEVHLEVDVPDLPDVKCRPAELNQAFMAVLTNAVQALSEEGGHVAVKARATAETIDIEIADTGRGIPAEEQANLFEPRIVRRGERVKMGLGLSTVKQALDRHEGEIVVDSREGAGTKVTLRIPREPAADLEASSPRLRPRR